MKDVFSTITIRGVIAITVTFGALLFFVLVASGLMKATESLLTQCTQAVSGALMYCFGHYFGSSHKGSVTTSVDGEIGKNG